MSEWKEYKLGDIAKFSYGRMPKKELLNNGIYPTFSGYKYQYTYPEYNCNEGDFFRISWNFYKIMAGFDKQIFLNLIALIL